MFGWQFQEYPGVADRVPHDAVFRDQGGAIMGAEATSAACASYFDVDDINTGAARVERARRRGRGGYPVPSMGWFAVCKDTEGTSSVSGRPIRTRPGA